MIKSPFGITVDEKALDVLKGLQPLDGEVTGTLKYSDVMKPDADGKITLGNLKVDASAVSGALDENAKAPKGAIKSLLSTAEKIRIIQENIEKQTTKLTTAIERNARKAILASPAGKNEIRFAELSEIVADTHVFNNPLGLASSVHRINNSTGVWYQIRLRASAITTVGSTESVSDARERLMNQVVNDRENLIHLAGLKLTDRNLSLVGHAVRPFNQELPNNQVGVVIGYSLTFGDLNKAMRVVNKLREASETGVLHVLNPTTTDSETLRLNLSVDNLIEELQTETQVDEEKVPDQEPAFDQNVSQGENDLV